MAVNLIHQSLVSGGAAREVLYNKYIFSCFIGTEVLVPLSASVSFVTNIYNKPDQGHLMAGTVMGKDLISTVRYNVQPPH